MSIVERSSGSRNAGQPLRLAVIGFGAIVQAKYLPALLKLDDLYEVTVVVARNAMTAAFASRRFPEATVLDSTPTDWSGYDVDAALVVTPPEGREDIVGSLLDAGIDVLAEKPLTLASATAKELAVHAERVGRVLLVAHTRRFDSTYDDFRAAVDGRRFSVATAHTLETPWQPVAELAPNPQPLNATIEFNRPLAAPVHDQLADLLGTSNDRALRYYRWVLAESMIHDLDLLRDSLGTPRRVEFAQFLAAGIGVTAVITFGDTPASITWVVADGLAEYDQVFELTADDARVTLRYPSPFLLYAQATVIVTQPHGTDPHGFREVRSTGSHEDAFQRLLRHFAELVAAGAGEASSAHEAAVGLAVAQAVARSAVNGTAVPIRLPQ